MTLQDASDYYRFLGLDSNNSNLFSDSNNNELSQDEAEEKWKVLIVDDEPEIHRVTKFVLSGFECEGKPLQFIHAYSGAEAKEKITENPDTAVIFLDVVMEDNDSGLQVVHYIRKILENHLVRVILRTGHPGEAPEKKVIVDYDINDYKEKTELTADKMFTVMLTSIRAYRDILIIEAQRKGLARIVKASSTIFKLKSLRLLSLEVLLHLVSILRLDQSSYRYPASGFILHKKRGRYILTAGIGKFSEMGGIDAELALTEDLFKDILTVARRKENIFEQERYIGYLPTYKQSETIIFLESNERFGELEKSLIQIFSTHIQVALENALLIKENLSTQKEIIYSLGEIAEIRSKETGFHVKRVSKYSLVLADKYGLPEHEKEVLRMAAAMHDVGKVAIPDAILNKPGPLDEDEFEIMTTHAIHGHEMLISSQREVLRAAAIISLQHHERWNGGGYPLGLKGNEIHIFARIVSIVDVFDALCNDRVYRKAWNLDKIFNLFKEERGKHFDPDLIDIFFAHKNIFLEIKDRFDERKKDKNNISETLT
jgi:response regulator RpfG family c-di-GMP phosphodiesterase